MESIPTDIALYNRIKKNIYINYPIHSAYRSGMIVKKYKSMFALKYGDKISPYKSNKKNKNGLTRWFNEKWSRDKKGNVGYNKTNDVYRPLVRITKNTPTTWFELSNYEINKAKKEKKEKGRVLRFKKK